MLKLDLRTSLAILAGVTAWVLAFSDPLWNLPALGFLIIVLVISATPLRGLRSLLGVLPVMLLVAVFAVFVPPGRLLQDADLARVWWQAGPLRATVGGALLAATYLLRMGCMVIASWLVVADASLDEVLDLAAKWRAPVWASTMLGVAITTIPTLAERREQIMAAQQARGARPGGNPLARWTAAVALMVPLITSALASANGLGIALAVRGHGAHRSQTMMNDLRWTPGNLALAAIALLAGAAALIASIAFGMGRL